MRKSTILWFYFGTLISSIGSFSFNICLVAFMAKGGFDLFHVSLILGTQRLVPLLISTLVGHHTDNLPPRPTVVATEVSAAIISLGIVWAWSMPGNGYWYLASLIIIKACIVSFQAGSRAKITKIFSDASYASNASHAIWVNKATQGATLFAGLCAWPIVKYLNFQTAIWFDLSTFALNSLIVFLLPIEDGVKKGLGFTISILSKFTDFYKYNRRAAFFDLLLAVSMMGTTSFTARLTGNDKTWMAVFIGSYGASVWLSGFIERSQILKDYFGAFWIGLGISYILLGQFAGHGLVTLAFVLCKDTFYWLLYHRISSHIQNDTPREIFGSVTSARMTQMVLVLAIGELAVGAWSSTLPIVFDGLWRGIFCTCIFAALMLPMFGAVQRDGYAKL